MKNFSIGFYREDGDFQILATLNNSDDYLLKNEFMDLLKFIEIKLSKKIHGIEIISINRQDCPDYVTLD